MPEEVTQSDVVSYVSAQILSGPEDDIWDAVFDWIANAIHSVATAIANWWWGIWETLKTQLGNLWNAIISPIKTAIDWIKNTASNIWNWVLSIFTMVKDWVVSAYKTVAAAVSSVIGTVRDWIVDTAKSTWDWIATNVQKVWGWITTGLANLSSTIWGWLKEQWRNISGLFSTWGKNIGDWFVSVGQNIAGFFTDLWKRLQAGWDWLSNLVTKTIPGLLSSWWDGFLGKLLDFGSWVGPLFSAIWNWVSRDIPGGSPWWETVGESIMTFLYRVLVLAPIKIASFIGKVVWDTVMFAFRSVGEVLMQFFNQAMTELSKVADTVGQGGPSSAQGTQEMLTRVCSTVLAGLAAMTIAGELTVVGSKLGFGQVSAMIYDLTNYKVLTGAFVGALAYAAVRTPLTYYYNEKFRPKIPDDRDLMRLVGEYAITKDEYIANMAYQGYSNAWSEKLYELADRPEGYFFLRAIASTGDWDEGWMLDSLKNTQYRMPTIKKAMVAFKRMATEQVRGSMSGYAITRYKEGLTSDNELEEELRLLRYSEEEIPVFVSAAKLAYATDYVIDLKAAYTAAANKGQISLDEYRSALRGLGISGDRVAAFSMRVKATLNPKGRVTTVTALTPVYETDAGKLQVDTLRRLRRKGLISRDQEMAGLLELGMEVSLANSTAANDDVRLAEKAEEG
jgi:hypothetical protein